MEPSTARTGWAGLTEETEETRCEVTDGVAGQRSTRPLPEPLTCRVQSHAERLRPALRPRHVVPHPGRHQEDGRRVEDASAGEDSVPAAQTRRTDESQDGFTQILMLYSQFPATLPDQQYLFCLFLEKNLEKCRGKKEVGEPRGHCENQRLD